jgi:hypothetical protein
MAESDHFWSWWLVWAGDGRQWVLGSSKAVNVACLAVFDPSTNSALSRQPECAVSPPYVGIWASTLDIYGRRSSP